MEDQTNFRRMPVIHPYKKILDKAFSKASEASELVSARDRLLQIRIKELKRVETSTDSIVNYLNKVVDKTPHVNLMPQYYVELVSLVIDKAQFKKSLGAVRWAAEMSKSLETMYKKKLKGAQARDLARIRGEFYGRLSSILHQIRRDLTYLEDARSQLKNMPAFKEMKTVVIAGFPNVGKSSVLKALTGAEPDIQPYPFTTKTVKVGYIDKYVQIVDTPGLLDRSLDKRNKIEFHAIIALDHLAEMILFVFDPSETCGYTMEEQMKLYDELRREFDLPFTVCINKVDILGVKPYDKYLKRLGKDVFIVSAHKNEGFKEMYDFFVKDALPSKKKFYEKKKA
ncbi:MAG: 50S ribosome-binding GTPase [Candidatus Aenigmarchaeota archaeon]|nr:50S ribosome-binding GTPase [Candidatus Aenigmarchaeota archaeon]